MPDPFSLGFLVAAGAMSLASLAGIPAFDQWAQLRRARTGWALFGRKHGLASSELVLSDGRRLGCGGVWEGRRIEMAAALLRRGSGWTTITVPFDPPLDLGLVAHERREEPTAGAWDRGSFLVVADDRERADALLDDDALRLATSIGKWRWSLSDHGVVAGLPYMTEEPDRTQLHRVGLAAVALANAIDARRARTPSATDLAPQVGSWRDVALRNGWSFGTTPLAMHGGVGEVPVAAFAFRRERHAFGLAAWASFSEPLDGAVGLAPTKPGELASFLGIGERHPDAEDWELGDAAFDGAFVVRARDASKLAQILPPSIGGRLLRLHERYPLVLDDRALRVASRDVPPPAVIPALLREMAEIAASIEENAIGKKPTRGPYR